MPPEEAEGHIKLILFHDNTIPHTANIVEETLQLLGWEVLSHSPHLINIGPSD